jgi:type IV pilus assembly protein PilM
VTYGYTELETNLSHSSSIEEQQKTAEVIKRVFEEAKVSTRKTVAALPNFSVFSSIISLPEMSKKELAKAITWEAKKFVPLPIEQMVLDWRPLVKSEDKKPGGDDAEAATAEAMDRLKKGQKYQKILITAAPKDLVDRYVSVFSQSNLDLLAMETESFALERSLVGKDPAVIMIVNLGAFSSDISITENGIPILSRSIDVGGGTITQAIARSLNIEHKRAEQFKRDIGFSNQSLNSVPKIIENTISPIINEIKYSFDLFQGRHGGGSIEKIILTGGSSVLPGLTDYLKKILQINVYVGDPWARIIYPLELKPILEELGPRFAGAVGLAMREIF